MILEEKGSDTCTRDCHYKRNTVFGDFVTRNSGNVAQKDQYLVRKVS